MIREGVTHDASKKRRAGETAGRPPDGPQEAEGSSQTRDAGRGLVGFGAYKMTSSDAARIEEHTGLPPEDLEDQDLEEAMADLGIEKQYVHESDQEAGG